MAVRLRALDFTETAGGLFSEHFGFLRYELDSPLTGSRRLNIRNTKISFITVHRQENAQ